VIGGLYAVGYTAAQLDTIVRTEDWLRLLTDPVDRRDLAVDRKFTEDHYLVTLPIERGGIKLPRSVVPGQRVSQLLTGLTWSAHRSKCAVWRPRDVRALSTCGFARGRGVIARGEGAARAAIPAITAALARGRVPRPARPARTPLVQADSVRVTTVRFDPADLV